MSIGIIWRCSYKRIIAGIVMLVTVMQLKRVLALPLLCVILLQVLIGVVVYFGILLIMKDDILLELVNIGCATIKKKEEKS